jgi:hypothetical protein
MRNGRCSGKPHKGDQYRFVGETWARPQLKNSKALISMVGGSGIEPLTPSMSKNFSPLYNQDLSYRCTAFARVGVGIRSALLASLDTSVCK